MTKFLKVYFGLVSVLIFSVLLVSCNKERKDRQTHKMSVWATYGQHAVGIGSGVGVDGGLESKALAIDGGGALNAYWQTTDNVYVYNNTWTSLYGGSLRPQSEALATQLKGSITGGVVVGDHLKLLYPRSTWSYTGQKGTIEGLAADYDYATAEVEVTAVGSSISATSATFTNEQAVVKFTLLKDDDTPLSVTSLKISDLQGKLIQSISAGERTFGDVEVDIEGAGSSVVYASLKGVDNSYLKLTATGSDGKLYTYCKDGATFEKGKYYAVTVKMQCLSNPLSLKAIAAGTITFDNKAAGAVYYKVNGGAEMTIAAGTSAGIAVAADDVVSFFGNNTTYAAGGGGDYSKISCTSNCYVYGNIMSLISKDGFSTLTSLTGTDNFRRLFYNNTKLYSHPSKKLLLPATTIGNYAYSGMFYKCTHLTVAPDLPAMTIGEFCYADMFSKCSGLTKAPTIAAKVTAQYCFQRMFNECTALTDGGVIRAETLAEFCCSDMYNGCTALVTAPVLSASTLNANCYEYMFSGCTNLVNAPVLPAETLAVKCYMSMFKNCSSLNYVKCLAKNISALECTLEWMEGVAGSGTFVTPSTTGWGTGVSGIPSGWTKVNAE